MKYKKHEKMILNFFHWPTDWRGGYSIYDYLANYKYIMAYYQLLYQMRAITKQYL